MNNLFITTSLLILMVSCGRRVTLNEYTIVEAPNCSFENVYSDVDSSLLGVNIRCDEESTYVMNGQDGDSVTVEELCPKVDAVFNEIAIKIGNKYVAFYASKEGHLTTLKDGMCYRSTDTYMTTFCLTNGVIVCQ